MKTYRGPLYTFALSWRWVVSNTPRLLYPRIHWVSPTVGRGWQLAAATSTTASSESWETVTWFVFVIGLSRDSPYILTQLQDTPRRDGICSELRSLFHAYHTSVSNYIQKWFCPLSAYSRFLLLAQLHLNRHHTTLCYVAACVHSYAVVRLPANVCRPLGCDLVSLVIETCSLHHQGGNTSDLGTRN
jgi:hypothetical protein